MTNIEPNKPQIPELDSFDPADMDNTPGWPKVVGIISIVWASLGLLCNGCGLTWFLGMDSFMKGAEQQMGGPMPDVMKPSTAQIGLTAAGLIPVILLMVSGILTVTRKAPGRATHIAYACLALLLGLAGIAIGAKQQIAMSEWAAQNPGDKWAQQHKPAIGWAILVFVGGLSVAWPVFCLIWFGVMKKRPEIGSRPLSEVM